MNKKFINQQNRLFNQLKKGIEFIIEKGRFGDWADIRTSSSAIWALCNCLVQKKKPGYIEGAIRRLFESTECETDENGLTFNYETWDTSLALIAIYTSALKNFKSAIEKIQNWIHAEFNLGSVRDEPWETLWALLSLLLSEDNPNKNSKKYINYINWLLKKRNEQGVLISAHYCGLLLGVLNLALKRLNLDEKLIKEYQNAQRLSLNYILEEFESGLKDDRLWRDEPWQIGHILFGISHSSKLSEDLYLDFSFNEELEAGLQSLWDDENGWIDMVDTSELAVGLSSYLFARSDQFMKIEKNPNLLFKGNFYESVSFYRNISAMKPIVFISYSSKDKKYADQLAEAIKKHGAEVWYDKNDILVGHSIVNKIYKGIRNSDYFAIILTKNSVNSKWVKEELTHAKMKEIESENVVILPLLYEDCIIPEVLADKHYANFRDSFDEGFLDLLQILFPLNIKIKDGLKVHEKYPLPPEQTRCRFCGSENIIGARIDAVADKNNPNILCKDCGNWI
jgi:hypothetical protein